MYVRNDRYLEVIMDHTWVDVNELMLVMMDRGVDFDSADESACWQEILEMPYYQKIKLSISAAFAEGNNTLGALEEVFPSINHLRGARKEDMFMINGVGVKALPALVKMLEKIGVGYDPDTGRLWDKQTEQSSLQKGA